MTLQEMFDKIVLHARTQKCKATTGKGLALTCMYRTLDGRKCFIGALIPDENYNESFESIALCHPDSAPIYKAANIPDELAVEASRLQRIHDEYTVAEWEEKFEHFANFRNLTYTAP